MNVGTKTKMLPNFCKPESNWIERNFGCEQRPNHERAEALLSRIKTHDPELLKETPEFAEKLLELAKTQSTPEAEAEAFNGALTEWRRLSAAQRAEYQTAGKNALVKAIVLGNESLLGYLTNELGQAAEGDW